MDCRLVIVSGDAPNAFVLKEGVTTIGRETDNDIQLANSDVSRHHARVHNFPGAAEIEDLGSANGTHVNGARVDRVRLMPGCQIRIGPIILAYEEGREGGAADADSDREYSDRVRVTTVRTRAAPSPDGETIGSGPRPVRPLRPIKPLKPKS